MMQLNRSGADTQPCLTPLEMVNQSERVLLMRTQLDVSVYSRSSTRIILDGMPMEWRMCHRQSRSTESNAALRSLKAMTKDISKVGTWNVRTMYEASKTAQIPRETRAYNIGILGLCETRWTESGQTMLNTGDTVLYSGHEGENPPHTEGVALMLSHQAYNALIGWEALGPRMMRTSFKTRMEKIQLNIIQRYAPTNDEDEGSKEDFYNKLQTVMDKMKQT